jgi:hypothetical protein
MALGRPPTPAAELLIEAGHLLYGDNGIAEFGEALGEAAGLGGAVNIRTIMAWKSGKTQLASDHAVMQTVRALLVQRRAEIDDLIRRVDDNIA